MRDTVPLSLNLMRLRAGPYASDNSMGFTGAFFLRQGKAQLKIISSGLEGPSELHHGWEHVSVSCKHRCPTWNEMCKVKNLFWDRSEVVMQYHPSEEHYVNLHDYCLHMWKPPHEVIMPPKFLVG